MNLPIYMIFPFVILLLVIACFPLWLKKFWDSNRNKAIVSLILSFPIALYFIYFDFSHLIGVILEYFSFIMLLASLFIISGGIFLKGDIKASPKNNTIFLLVGSILASLIGTTGASMLMINPILNTNKERKHVAHTVIFLIFLVSNIGGSLTPIGDPPLFLGYLKGVPFFWTLTLWPEWLFSVVILLSLYFFIDKHFYKKESVSDILKDNNETKNLSLEGIINLFFLFGIILTVVFINTTPLREILMLIFIILSLKFSPKEARTKNKFSFNPIIEVAVLFFGIFITMLPALLILKERGASLGIVSPTHFFWCSGALSSFLDNAPTYAVFFELAKAVGGSPDLIAGVPVTLLKAISLGAVFMGANSYIGNGPNFMVKTVSEEFGIKMPSFFGYMMWSIGILIPLFLLVTFLFII